jgi:hypothetical protein
MRMDQYRLCCPQAAPGSRSHPTYAGTLPVTYRVLGTVLAESDLLTLIELGSLKKVLQLIRVVLTTHRDDYGRTTGEAY